MHAAATVKCHALSLYALENIGRFASQTRLALPSSTLAKLAAGPSAAEREELQLNTLSVTAELRESADTLRLGDARRTDLLDRSTDLDAIADYAAAKAAKRRLLGMD